MNTRTILLFALVLAIGSPAGAATVARYRNLTQGTDATTSLNSRGDIIEIIVGLDTSSGGGTVGFSIDVEYSEDGTAMTLGDWVIESVASVEPLSCFGERFSWTAGFIGIPVPYGDYLKARFTIPHCIYDFDVFIDVSYSGSFCGDTPPDVSLHCYLDDNCSYDYGDAPAPYPTLRSDCGASHRNIYWGGNIYLGQLKRYEGNGSPSIGADSSIDDDGVFFLTNIIPDQAADVKVIASDIGKLDAWLDFNIDGDWLDPGEQIFTSYPLNPGDNIITFNVPTEAVEGDSYARFRVSTSGGLKPDRATYGGEVEDYMVFIGQVIQDLDYGDAPQPYPTLVANNGAYHIIDSGLYLGQRFDFEADGRPSAGADGDDANGIDDEDGVFFLTNIMAGDAADVNVVASAAGLLDAWLDFNIDGDWLDPGEQIFTSYPLNPGGNIITFNVPTEAIGGDSYARFRFSTSGGLDPNGPAEDGEVEDYKVFIGPCPCWGDGNGDGKNDAADMTLLMLFLFLYGGENRWLVPLWDGIIIPEGYECMNLNGDYDLSAADMTLIMLHLFFNGGNEFNGWTADFCYNGTFQGL